MLDIIIGIAISLNLQFTVIDESSLELSHIDVRILTTSDELLRKIKDGSVYDLSIKCIEEDPEFDIIIVPEVDPSNEK
jgi:hypothetical protein